MDRLSLILLSGFIKGLDDVFRQPDRAVREVRIVIGRFARVCKPWKWTNLDSKPWKWINWDLQAMDVYQLEFEAMEVDQLENLS